MSAIYPYAVDKVAPVGEEARPPVTILALAEHRRGRGHAARRGHFLERRRGRSRQRRSPRPDSRCRPETAGVSHSVTAGPPATSIFLSLPSAKNPRDRLSGDQKGEEAPSVPGSSCAVSVSSARTHRRLPPVAAFARKAIRDPSGDTASGAGDAPVGAAGRHAPAVRRGHEEAHRAHVGRRPTKIGERRQGQRREAHDPERGRPRDPLARAGDDGRHGRCGRRDGPRTRPPAPAARRRCRRTRCLRILLQARRSNLTHSAGTSSRELASTRRVRVNDRRRACR